MIGLFHLPPRPTIHKHPVLLQRCVVCPLGRTLPQLKRTTNSVSLSRRPPWTPSRFLLLLRLRVRRCPASPRYVICEYATCSPRTAPTSIIDCLSHGLLPTRRGESTGARGTIAALSDAPPSQLGCNTDLQPARTPVAFALRRPLHITRTPLATPDRLPRLRLERRQNAPGPRSDPPKVRPPPARLFRPLISHLTKELAMG